MMSASRRDFFGRAAGLGMGGLTAGSATATAAEQAAPLPRCTEVVSLDGEWLFRLDPDGQGEASGWHQPGAPDDGWRAVVVPHTWQTEAESAEYSGAGWYRRALEIPAQWNGRRLRLEFEAVFHSAWVWVNGKSAGKHIGKGYTAFCLDITALVEPGGENVIVVRADNSFSETMLPRGRSSDWTHDGGIYRPVHLLVTPPVFIARVDVDAVPNLEAGSAELDVTVYVCNQSGRVWQGAIGCEVTDERTGLTALTHEAAKPLSVGVGERRPVKLGPLKMPAARWWSFDDPQLYELTATIGGPEPHSFSTTFGVRQFEVRAGAFYLNGERVSLMGVERMAGSNPEFGMAEPSGWLTHDHDDMKELNCVFTRVHWPQDKRVLDYCDRRGILIQTEVPTWGPRTFRDMEEEPDPAIMRNGLEQLREMIARDRNHPSIFAWGLCNEIGGQHPPAYKFAARMYEEAKHLDPRRLRSYASNSLRETPEKDVSALMDFVEWNEYYGSWYPGTTAELRDNVERLITAFPGKPIVISEYGWCACTADRPEGDAKRVDILVEHNRIFRDFPQIGGLIFFCYNDYRTHIGDKGKGVMKQRVHGVVDLYGNRKPSFEALRKESSPVELLRVDGRPPKLEVAVRTRKLQPGYTLRGYSVRAVVFGYGDIPLERYEMALPEMAPGAETAVSFEVEEKLPWRIQVDVMRPTGFSALTTIWRA